MHSPKLDKAIAQSRIPIKAARFFSGKLLKEIAASIEHGETPELFLTKTWNEKRCLWEVQIITIAPQHRIEQVSYATKDPKTWRSIGQIVMTPEQAMKMAFELKTIAAAPTKAIMPLTRYREFKGIETCIDFLELKSPRKPRRK